MNCPRSDRVYVAVPYTEKDRAKRLGAMWDNAAPRPGQPGRLGLWWFAPQLVEAAVQHGWKRLENPYPPPTPRTHNVCTGCGRLVPIGSSYCQGCTDARRVESRRRPALPITVTADGLVVRPSDRPSQHNAF